MPDDELSDQVTIVFSVRTTSEMAEDLRLIARERRVTLQHVIREALADYIRANADHSERKGQGE